MSGIQVKYSELFRVNILQPYYLNEACKKYSIAPEPDFTMVPTSACLATMKKLDFVFRLNRDKNGFIILSRISGITAGGDNMVRFSPAKGDKLTFWLQLNNPSMLNHNILPVAQDSSKVFYFSNQVNDVAAPRTNLHLTTSDTGVDDNLDRVNISRSTYQFKHSAPLVSGTAVVRHQSTGIERQPFDVINEPASSHLSFRLNDLPEGLYKLLISNIEKDAFYYTGTDLAPKILGVIEIALDTGIIPNYRIIEADKSISVIRPVYTILFRNRPTIWRYTVELQKNSPLFLEMEPMDPVTKNNFINGLNIETNDTGITFLQTFASPDGKKFQFESNAPVLLKEKYYSSSGAAGEPLRLALKKFANFPGEIIIKNDLPYPAASHIDASNAATIYSDTLLTL